MIKINESRELNDDKLANLAREFYLKFGAQTNINSITNKLIKLKQACRLRKKKKIIQYLIDNLERINALSG